VVGDGLSEAAAALHDGVESAPGNGDTHRSSPWGSR
jgi:hypothetical protein